MSRLKRRTGASIREFLRYYALFLLKRKRLTEGGIIEKIKEESACNRQFRASGQLAIATEDLRKVLAGLKRRNLVESACGKWRVTRQGQEKLDSYAKHQQGEGSDSKEMAVRLLLEWMGGCKSGQMVLDVGTGEGYLAFKVAERGCRVLGIDSGSLDYSKDSIKAAREEAESRGGQVEFMRESVTSLQGMDGRFDCVVSSQAIHCMEDQLQC